MKSIKSLFASIVSVIFFISTGAIFAAGDSFSFKQAPPDSNCFEAHGGVGCDNAECEAIVAAVDPFCVNVQWDSICAGEAIEMCPIDNDPPVPAPDTAAFRVIKNFTDDNDEKVEVNIQCNAGTPLNNTFEIAEGSGGVTFNLELFNSGEPTCTITESPVPGYVASYYDNDTVSSEGCVFEAVELNTGYICTITNSPAPVPLTIKWTWESGEHEELEYAWIEVDCSDVFAGPNFWSFDVNGDGENTVEVTPINETEPATTCHVTYGSDFPQVEGEGCEGPIEIPFGSEGVECEILFTLFFEGIPTLDARSKMALILLLLGVGFVGLRRLA